VVIWGGSNDIGRNNSREALKHLCNFVENNQKVNTVVMNAHHRYDLPLSSCMNNEVISFNTQLKKRMAPYNNVKILETGLEREYFTKHGMHMDRLCGLVVRVSGYRYRGPGFDESATCRGGERSIGDDSADAYVYLASFVFSECVNRVEVNKVKCRTKNSSNHVRAAKHGSVYV